MLKRYIAMLLCLSMVLSMVPAQVYAEEIQGETVETTAPTETACVTETAETVASAEIPETTAAVEETEAPETTETVEETEVPETTETVEETEAPDTTEAVEETETTEATEETVPEISQEAATAVTASGSCGTNLTWTLTSDGVLTISGSGEMKRMSYNTMPWYDYISSITRVTVGSGITSIGDYAFYGCENMTSVSLPASLTSIGEYAFCGCGMSSVAFPDNLTSISRYAFVGCDALTMVELPASLTSLGVQAFGSCDNLQYIYVESGNTAFASDAGRGLYNKAMTTLIRVPEKQTGRYVIPDTVRSIQNYAFSYCQNLTDVVIPDGVTTIGEGAFAYCYGLTNVVLPSGISVLEKNVFGSCENLTGVMIPNGVTRIRDHAFSFTGLTEIMIPETVTSIGLQAFHACSDLTEIWFRGDAPSIDSRAFTMVTATVRYPEGNSTWTDSVRQDYGGTLTWEPYTVIESLSVRTMPSKTWYVVGEAIDLTGLVLEDQNGNQILPDNGITIVSGSTAAVGRSSVTVTYGGVTAAFEIVVHQSSGTSEVLQPSSGYPESPHEYTNNFTQTYTYSVPGARYLKLTFSSSTRTEGTHDKIYIYDGNDVQQGSYYTGTQLTGQTIQVEGDTVKIKLTTDGSVTYYGFSLSSIYAGVDGFCHTYQNGACVVCGQQPQTGIRIGTMPDKTWYLVGESIDLTGLQLWVEDQNGTVRTVSHQSVTLVSGSTQSAGRKTVTVSYSGQQTTFQIVVHEVSVREVLQPSSGYPESPHEYTNNFTQTYTYSVPGAQYLKLTFSSSTRTEGTYDKIYIYDGNDVQQGSYYTGTQLTGQTIRVEGDTVKIKLTTDSSVTYYGFSLSGIYAGMPGGIAHSYENGVCIACGMGALTGLRVQTLPAKTSYLVGETVNLSGLRLLGVDAQGNTQVLAPEDVTLISGSTQSSGRKTVTVGYESLTAQFEIVVHNRGYGEVLQPSSGYPASAHNYSNNFSQTYTYRVAGAQYLKLTFSSSTQTESGYDYIYIYNGSDTQLGKYSGTSLASQTIRVDGDTVKIKLTTDVSNTYYGFSFSSIYACVPGGGTGVQHEYTGVYTAPTCTVDGYTAYTCFCGDSYVEQDEGSATGEHSYGNGVYTEPTCDTDGYTTTSCSICGHRIVEQDEGSARHTFVDGVCTGCGIHAPVVGTLPNKTLYAVGESINLTGLEVAVTDADGSTTVFTPEDGMTVLSGDTSEVGAVTVTVGWDNLTASFEIFVHESNYGEVLQPSSGYPESAHQYSNNMDRSYTYSVPGAQYLQLTFSSNTEVESNYDKIYIYDGNDVQQGGYYTGTQLAFKTITVYGDTVRIRLTTDGSVTKYGFSLISIYASLPIDMVHSYTPVYTPPTCSENGYTTYRCFCGDSYVEPGETATGHTYVNGFCITCGLARPTDIQVCTMPDKYQYLVGETIDLTGIELLVTFTDGSTRILTMQDGIVLFSGSTEEAGRPVLTVGTPEFSAEFEIQVHEGGSGWTLMPQNNYPESPHNYTDDMDESYTYRVSDAQSLRLVFSSETVTEDGWDYIYLYNASDVQIGKYSGTELAGQSVEIPGDTVRIRLTSGRSVTRYGFSLTAIYAQFGGVRHEPSDEGVYTQPTCSEDGYTTHTCWICDAEFTRQDYGSAGHSYGNGFCLRCGIPEHAVATGTSRDAYWSVGQDGVLYITGQGAMATYAAASYTPWYSYRDQIIGIVVGDGITMIGAYAFDGLEKAKTLYIGSSVAEIGRYAIANCDGLTSVVLPDSVRSIGYAAFDWCANLAEVTVSKNIRGINAYGFNSCKKLKKITFRGDAPSIESTVFNEVNATAYYPAGNSTWTDAVRQNYGGKIKWVTINASRVQIFDENGEDVSGKVLWVDRNADLEPLRFYAAAEPADIFDRCTWSLTQGPAQMRIDDDGSWNLVPTGESGSVTLRAYAGDGKISAAVEIKYVSLAPEREELPGEDPADMNLLSGKSVQLRMLNADTGKPLDSKLVTWSVDDVYAPFVKIDAKGKLTAKKVVEKTRIEAVGSIIGSEQISVTVKVDVYPAVTMVELLQGTKRFNDKNLPVDQTGGPLVLTANIHPLDAMEGVVWSVSDGKRAFASYEMDGNTLTVYPRTDAKAGTVTVKATSVDGSKKAATVKLQFGVYARQLHIENRMAVMTAGESVQLTATVEPAAVSKPGVVWSLKNPNDKNYVSLSASGKLSAKAVLSPVDVTLVATSKDGMASDEYTISVRPKSEAQLVLRAGDAYVTKTTQVLDVGSSITLSAHTYGDDAVAFVDWTPKEHKAARIVENLDGTLTVRMTAEGSVNITAASGSRKATVTIKAVNMAESVEISQKKTNRRDGLEVSSGKSLDLQAAVAGSSNKKVTWSVMFGEKYAAISSAGKLTAAKNLTTSGFVVVRATAADGSGVYDEIGIVVRPISQGVQVYSEAGGQMLFDFRSRNWWVRSNTTLVWDLSTQGQTIALDAHVFPYYGENDPKNASQSVIGKSSAPKVAALQMEMDQFGQPTGKVYLEVYRTGTTTITVTAGDGSGQKVNFKLNVVKTVTELSIDNQTVKSGKNLNLNKFVTVGPADATNKKLDWTILSGGNYATVSGGTFKAKKVSSPKTVRVRVSSQDGGAEAVFTVTITP